MQEGDLLMRRTAVHLETHSAADANRLSERAEEMARKADALRDMVMAESDVAPAKS